VNDDRYATKLSGK